MINVLICGAGRIGIAVAAFLANSETYRVHLADIDFSDSDLQRFLQRFDAIHTIAMDVRDSSSFMPYFSRHDIKAVISCLPSIFNPHVALAAREMSAHYFDLGENIRIASEIREIASGANSAFVVDCGCAPGFVGVITHDLLQQYETCISAEVRVGVLQQAPVSSYDVAADCPVKRVITEYTSPCTIIDKEEINEVPGFSGLETITIDGQSFEAFYTAGGLGHLIPAYEGKIAQFDYKSIHYSGHCEKMQFLLAELNLREDTDLLEQVLARIPADPKADQILIAISTTGMIDDEICQRQHQQRLLPMQYEGMEFSAMQSSTAAGVCAVFDQIMQDSEAWRGLIAPEQFPLATLLTNPFAKYYLQ